MSYEVKQEDKYTIISVTADKLDTHIAPEVKSDLVKLKSAGVKNIILDLSNAKYCDSSGLSAILVAHRICKDKDGVLVLAGLQDSVMKLITISQLDSILKIVPTVDEAVDYLFMEEIEQELGNEDTEE